MTMRQHISSYKRNSPMKASESAGEILRAKAGQPRFEGPDEAYYDTIIANKKLAGATGEQLAAAGWISKDKASAYNKYALGKVGGNISGTMDKSTDNTPSLKGELKATQTNPLDPRGGAVDTFSNYDLRSAWKGAKMTARKEYRANIKSGMPQEEAEKKREERLSAASVGLANISADQIKEKINSRLTARTLPLGTVSSTAGENPASNYLDPTSQEMLKLSTPMDMIKKPGVKMGGYGSKTYKK